MYRLSTIIFCSAVLLSNCSRKNIAPSDSSRTSSLKLVDKNATPETKALFCNLKKLSKDHTLFGHQHATQYGHGWSGDADRSDVKSVTGSHPAVIGIDISGFSGGSPA